MLNGEYENLVEVRKNEERVDMKTLLDEERHFVEMMMVYERIKHERDYEL